MGRRSSPGSAVAFPGAGQGEGPPRLPDAVPLYLGLPAAPQSRSQAVAAVGAAAQGGTPGTAPRLARLAIKAISHRSRERVCVGHLWLSWQPPELCPSPFYVSSFVL